MRAGGLSTPSRTRQMVSRFTTLTTASCSATPDIGTALSRCRTSVQPGTPFETIVRMAAESGHIADAAGEPEGWVAERLAVHRTRGSLCFNSEATDDGF